jgi:hypothetical protein
MEFTVKENTASVPEAKHLKYFGFDGIWIGCCKVMFLDTQLKPGTHRSILSIHATTDNVSVTINGFPMGATVALFTPRVRVPGQATMELFKIWRGAESEFMVETQSDEAPIIVTSANFGDGVPPAVNYEA